MTTQQGSHATDYSALDDLALAARVRSGDRQAFRQIMQRCNQRLFRVVRSVIRDDAEAEDVVQETYLQAYQKIDDFRGEASLATWLSRIGLNEAFGRLRRRRSTVEIDAMESGMDTEARLIPFPSRPHAEDPATHAARSQLRAVLEQAVDELPEAFRTVYVLRDIEGCSVRETADALSLREETVRTRLHRARRQLRELLQEQFSCVMDGAFPFLGARCAAMTREVMARIETLPPGTRSRSKPTPHP